MERAWERKAFRPGAEQEQAGKGAVCQGAVSHLVWPGTAGHPCAWHGPSERPYVRVSSPRPPGGGTRSRAPGYRQA